MNYGSPLYENVLEYWRTPQPYAWWISRGNKNAKLDESLTFANGQTAKISVRGKFKMFRPTVQFAPISAGTLFCEDGELKLEDAEFSATVKSSFPGRVNWVQLINRTVLGDWPGYVRLNTFGGYWLDNDLFYNTVGGDVGTPAEHTDVGPGIDG